MPTEITIHFDDDERDRALITFGELEYRFGADHYVAHRELEPDLTDDETEADIVEILRAMQVRMGHSNGAMRVVDTLIEMAQGDQQPPGQLPAPQPKPTKKSFGTQGSGTKVAGLESVACPTCHAGIGETCVTDVGRRYYPGWGHRSRIMLVQPSHRSHGR